MSTSVVITRPQIVLRQLPWYAAAKSCLLDRGALPVRSQHRQRLLAQGRSHDRVRRVKTFRGENLVDDLVTTDRLPVSLSERIEDQPRELVAGKVPGTPDVGAL